MLLHLLAFTWLHAVFAVTEYGKLGKVKRINPMDTDEMRVLYNCMAHLCAKNVVHSMPVYLSAGTC